MSNPGFCLIRSRVPALAIFQSRVERDLKNLEARNIREKKSRQKNLTKAQYQAIKDLKRIGNLVIRKVDKG